MDTYRHTDEMGEISGFGGGYETCCQDMLEAGCKWIEEHKGADLKMHGFKNLYGLFEADSPDAKAMEEVVLAAANGEATGAMHQTVMSRLAYIAANGWGKYRDELRKNEAARVAPSRD